MSISRSNWSALSRLAKQWSEDDEEEQIRERRRRNRILSNPADRVIEVLPEESNSSSTTLSRGHTIRDIERETQQPPQTQKDKEKQQEPEEEAGITKSTISQTNDNKSFNDIRKEDAGSKPTVTNAKKPVREKEEIISPRSKKEGSKGPISLRKERERSQDEENQTPTEEKHRPNVQKEETQATVNTIKDNQVFRIQKEETQVEQNINREDCGQDAGRTPSVPSITRISSVTTSGTSPPTETVAGNNSVTSSSTGNSSRYRSQVFVSSVRIPRRSSGSDGIQNVSSPPPVPEEGPLPALRTVKRTEVQATSTTNQNSNTDDLPTTPPAASSFRRFSPRTSSFRAMTHSEDQVEGRRGLTRSSSLRISLRSQKLEDRLEKYTSAAQRSESVRIPTLRSVTGLSDGIANKKSIFERDENSNAMNTTGARKDLTLPGAVSHRVNQWSNKNQHNSSTNTATKDIRTGDVASKRSMWQQRSQSSNDTKL
ncbi:ladinin-1 isoform X2 [Spea bombifrons]|uniref:ladinin-1 isoform X2 n=1 Tax=Spea bombifrons TaxID=233779 RepID=UPI00234B04B8|nr:ladinin-1 isoform X2 [Spea bombifrons]